MHKLSQKIILITLSVFLTLSVNVSSAENKPTFELAVKPIMCVRKIREQACDVSLQINWKSSSTGDYCLFNELTEVFLNCWENASNGQHIEQQSVTQSFDYWLASDIASIRLIETEFTVLDVRSPERRKNRRRRHVWSVL